MDETRQQKQAGRKKRVGRGVKYKRLPLLSAKREGTKERDSTRTSRKRLFDVCFTSASVTPPTRVHTNSPSGSRTQDSGVGGGRSNKECQRLQPLASFEVRGVRFYTHSPYWHTSVTLTPLNHTPIRVTAPM